MPLIPIALATGWSAGVLFLLGLLPGPLEVELNPMSVTLGALVIAISTEFSVLLSARYRQEREAGRRPRGRSSCTYTSTGAAVLASGVTAIAGFAALIASDIRMLRDFGILTVVDLSVSLLGRDAGAARRAGLGRAARPLPLRDLNPRPLLASCGSPLATRARRRLAAAPAAAAARVPDRGPLRRSRRAAEARSAPSASRRRTGSAPSPTCARAPAGGAAPGQPVRVGGRDRAVHGHRGAVLHGEPAEHGRRRARARRASGCPASRRRWPPATWTTTATPTSASAQGSEQAGNRLPACQVRAESSTSCELRERPLGADHVRHPGRRLRAPGGPGRADAQGRSRR